MQHSEFSCNDKERERVRGLSVLLPIQSEMMLLEKKKKAQRFEKTHVGSLTIGAFCLIAESLPPPVDDDVLAMNRQVVVGVEAKFT